MLKSGAFAVALVQRQVVVVQAARSHDKREKYIDVNTYAPFGERIFLASEVPTARIASSDILTVWPLSDNTHFPTQGMLELPKKAFSEYMELNERHQKRYESMWTAWLAKH